jgi:hypothetical protein
MLSEAIQHTIEQACVTVVSEDGTGRGVLVAGQMVLTAAHCVRYDTEGPMVCNDYFVHELQTRQGLVNVGPLAVEPCADIAVLGALDNQEEDTGFEAWCAAVTPMPICCKDVPVGAPFPVYIYTHRETWLEGTATLIRDDHHTLWLEVPEGIEEGTSGSPIVTARGGIVGVVSLMVGPDEKATSGMAPRPHLALPAWVMRRIQTWEDAC